MFPSLFILPPMNSKTTWTCVAIAAVLFALIVFVEKPFRKQSHLAASTKIFPGFNPATATRIEIRPSGSRKKIRAERSAGTWTLTSPLEYPAASPRIEGTLDALAALNWHIYIAPAELKDRPTAQEEFGFVEPVATLSVEHGNSVLNLLVGTNTPVGEQIYLQVLGDVGVYVVDKIFLQYLPITADDWRDPSVFRVTNAITSIKSRAGNKAFTITHTNGSWRMPQARADNTKVNELLKKTLALQVAQFETDNPQANLETFGLVTPEMELTFAADTNLLAVLQVGKSPTNDPAQVFAKLQNQPHIFRVAQETLAEWRASQTNFVDRRLASFAPTNITQIEGRGMDSFLLQRAGNGWSMAGVTNFAVDTELVQDVLNLLSRANVDIEKDIVTDFTSYGLESPALRYTLRTSKVASASIVAQIDFGTNQSGQIFVRRLDEYPDTVKSIQREQFARLPQASWQFRDRQIWNFSSNDVVSVAIQQKGQTRKLVRNAQNEWTFAAGSQGVMNPFAFDEAIHRLGDLKAVFWVAKDENNSESFLFKEVDHRIALEIKRGEKTETVSLEFGGFSEFGTRYAATMVDGSRMVFEFPWPLFFEVQDSLTITPK